MTTDFGLLTTSTQRLGTLRRVLIHDQADRDAIASRLLRYGDGRGDDWADIIRHADDVSGVAAERTGILAEIDATAGGSLSSGPAGRVRPCVCKR